MKYTRLALLLALVATPASAQWQVPDNAVPIGRGAGLTGFKNVPMPSGSLLIGQSGIPQAIIPTGDVTINASGVTAIGTAKVTAAMIAGMTSAQLAGILSDETGSGLAVFNTSPAFAGVPTAPTAAPGTNTTQLATTAFVLANATSAGVASFNGRTGAVVPGSSDYISPQIGYTPTGTGAVANNVKTQLDRVIYANDYGAVCNGSTNDATAFQNAINQGAATGLPVRWVGSCAINTPLIINSIVDFGGVTANGYQNPVSRLVGTNPAVDMIQVNTPAGNAVYLHDFSMNYSSAANPGTSAIVVTSPSSENAGSTFSRLTLNGNISTGINFARASAWVLNGSTITANQQAIIVANANNVDSGDSTIDSNHLQVGNGGTGIVYNSSGGLRVINNKINGTSVLYGLRMVLASGASTADLFMTGNSIEGISSTGSGIRLERAGATGGYGVVNIANNELSGQYCFQIPIDANGAWIFNIAVTGNTCVLQNVAGAVGFYVGSATSVNISGNSIQSFNAGSRPFITSTGATQVVIGPIAKIGSFFSGIANSTTIIDESTGTTFSDLQPAQNGSRSYVTDGTPGSSPCTGGGSGANAVRQNGAWKCL